MHCHGCEDGVKWPLTKLFSMTSFLFRIDHFFIKNFEIQWTCIQISFQ